MPEETPPADNTSADEMRAAPTPDDPSNRTDDSRDDKDDGQKSQPRKPSLVARYGLMQFVGQFRHNLDEMPSRGTKVVLRTDRGVELGEVIANVVDEQTDIPAQLPRNQLEQFIRENGGSEYPFRRTGKVLRLANKQDIIDQRHLDSNARDEAVYCRKQIAEFGLDMKLVSVEHLLGGERIVFYFTAEHRVDFRELVRTLAGQYRTRIEMRQVGARDEARLVADYERCGQRCCCQQFLKNLKPVSMRMAKVQKATLDPSKISGRCGRLMCCLRYEDDTYRDLKRRLPHKNTWVRTDDRCGQVRNCQIITQLVELRLQDGTSEVVANEAIIERDMKEPPPPEQRPARKPDRAKQKEDAGKKPSTESSDQGKADPAKETAKTGSADQGEDKPKKKRRRRRKKKPSGDGQPQNQKKQGGDGGDGGDGKPRKKRRRRRRKKKKPSGGGDSGGSGGGNSGGPSSGGNSGGGG
ncbi:MAG: stage 0 sporulation family protein [Phycisphaerae bacterium]